MCNEREGISMAVIDMSYRIVQQIAQAAGLLCEGGCFYLLANPYVEEKRTARIAGAVYALTIYAILLTSAVSGVFYIYGLGVFAAFFALFMQEQKGWEQKLFLALTFFSMRGFCDAIAEIAYDHVYDFAGETVFMHTHRSLYPHLYAGMCLLDLIVEAACLAGGIFCILAAVRYQKSRISQKWLLALFLVPAFTGALGYEMLGYYRSFYIRQTGQSAEGYDVLALFYYGSSLVTVLAAVTLYQGIRRRQEEKLQENLLAAQIESMRLHIEHVEGLYRDIRGMKHDMANHILTLEQLYEENQTKEARAYGADLKEMLAHTAAGMNSGNPVTDVVLQMHKEKAERMGIAFHAQFYFPADCGVRALDASIILNNALQNALEHLQECAQTPREKQMTERGAYLSVVSYRKNNAFLIEIENSFSGSLRRDANGMPRSTKGEGHGYGLANIQRVAKKYAGDIDLACDSSKFCLTVMLMLEG